MPDLLYPYLVGMVTTIVVLLAAMWAFIACYRRAIDLARKEERLPLAARWEDLSSRVADLELERDELRDELHQSKLLIEEAHRERDWLAQNRQEIEQMKIEREQLERVRADLVHAQEELGGARQRLEELRQKAQKADFIRQQLEERIKTLDERAKEQGAILKRDEITLEKLRLELSEGEKRLIELRRQLGDFGESVAQAQRRSEALQREIQELTQQRNVLKKQREQLELEAGEMRTKKAKLDEQLVALEERSEQLGSRLDELRREERKRDRNIASSAEGLAELWQPSIATDEYEDGDSELTETDALDRVREYLQSLKLTFSSRIVMAFHTSLKVAKDTPLLVLAGISGTGKSLLPRRYAEAMGIHFLNIAVQPRWDGPQDLLGFFNYLENRYKATELTRALIQLDPYEREWVPKDYGHFAHDRLLMVLLDEMNLARVEYYFSEFLSRLETRRDLDFDNHIDRMKAEIVLDVGRFSEEQDCRIFVDSNVFFVGTMNEDESTLTLSDKVIDRANVMRFSRPPTLGRTEGNGQPLSEELRAKSFLTKELWTSWIAHAAERELPLRDDIDSWIAELNNALTHIGRPFGYRTHNAILSYIQQYPDVSDGGVRLAMADQVEQRILPKLRGVDTAEDAGRRAIDGVRSVVQQLDDRLLLNAIESGARAEGGHLFTWLGVERSDEE